MKVNHHLKIIINHSEHKEATLVKIKLTETLYQGNDRKIIKKHDVKYRFIRCVILLISDTVLTNTNLASLPVSVPHYFIGAL